MTDIVERLRGYEDGDLVLIEDVNEAADEIERLRKALEQYRDGKYSGYVTLPCGWDDRGSLASYTLEGMSLDYYALDCEREHEKENS